jgi:hypothetical protein
MTTVYIFKNLCKYMRIVIGQRVQVMFNLYVNRKLKQISGIHMACC